MLNVVEAIKRTERALRLVTKVKKELREDSCQLSKYDVARCVFVQAVDAVKEAVEVLKEI